MISNIRQNKGTDLKPDKNMWIVVVMIVFITVCHYLIPIRHHYYHEIFRRLYYLPIILAAYQFGFYGGLVTSVVVCIVYLPHVIFQWAGHFLNNLVRFTEIILYIVVGSLAGFLSQNVKDERDRYKRTAEKLEVSYNQLETQTVQLAEMESQLRSADRLAVLGELSASLAHEVRNPLGSIKGAVDILRKRCPEDETAKEFSDLLLREVIRLNEVVDSYLSMARKPSIRKARTDLKEIIESVLDLVGPEIRKRRIHVKCDFSNQSLMARIQEIEAQQVFLNLILNALAALDDEGHVHIEGEVRAKEIVVKVSDTGKGIPKENIDRIFDPFFTTRREGLGLGLSIVKRIMQSNRGNINVDSEENKGTSFTLIFHRVK